MNRLTRWLTALLVGIATTAASLPAMAQGAWPTRPVMLIVPYAAGGFGDIRARQVAERLGKVLGQQVVVNNHPGAGGVTGTLLIARAAPDGYTIGMGNLAPLAVNRSLMKKLPYDPDADFEPVILLERAPLILSVHPAQGVTTLGALVAKARAEPGKLTYGSSGIGGAHHLSGAMLEHLAGIDLTHVPYKGGSAAASDLAGGHIAMMFEMGYAALPSIQGGRVRPLAVTSSRRIPLLKDVPTMAEAGLAGFESYNWQGIIAPRGTPAAIVQQLNKELNAILQMPAVREAIAAHASEPQGGTPEAFGAFVKAEAAKWGAVVRRANIQPE
ncbi:MAG: tripartite tricarboxylate transporter substrate binding protein [Burkholderiales bacterium]|nr:tripartite tricarboxylate transporter substrate binding protein [Burkholderiales bacterium]